MQKLIKISEYAQLKEVNESTVYRWIKKGDLNAKTVDGTLHVEDTDYSYNDIVNVLREENSKLKRDIKYIQNKLKEAQQTIQNISTKRRRSIHYSKLDRYGVLSDEEIESLLENFGDKRFLRSYTNSAPNIKVGDGFHPVPI